MHFFQDKMFHGSNPIISWNKTDIGAFFTMISRIFTEYDKNCFTFKVINIVLLIYIKLSVAIIKNVPYTDEISAMTPTAS